MNPKPVRILVADDERTLSFFLQKSLEADDPCYSVETSHSGAEALVRVVRTPFDLVIAEGTEVIRLNPERARGYRLHGQIYGKTGQWGKAARDVAKARRIEARQQ